jgi:alanine racemase
VKQNAYGHGLVPIAKGLSHAGVHSFGVGGLEEAITLREQGLQEPILVLSALLTNSIKELIEYRITPTVVDIQFARNLNREAIKKNIVVPVHIKIDTGMGRLGIWHKEAAEFFSAI